MSVKARINTATAVKHLTLGSSSGSLKVTPAVAAAKYSYKAITVEKAIIQLTYLATAVNT